jgi:hypothetical protein
MLGTHLNNAEYFTTPKTFFLIPSYVHIYIYPFFGLYSPKWNPAVNLLEFDAIFKGIVRSIFTCRIFRTGSNGWLLDFGLQHAESTLTPSGGAGEME